MTLFGHALVLLLNNTAADYTKSYRIEFLFNDCNGSYPTQIMVFDPTISSLDPSGMPIFVVLE